MKTWDDILAMHGLIDPSEMAWLRDNATGHCVELGSHYGKSACAMAYGVMPKNGQVTCFDLWGSFNGRLDGYQRYEEFKANVQGLPIDWHMMDSVEGASLYKPETVDFIFIDSNHEFEHTLKEIQAWYPKLKPGAWMTGHDYNNPGFPGVKQAVNAASLLHTVAVGSVWIHRKVL